MIYFGFDLGDGESCISWSRDLSVHQPMPVAVNGSMSFPTAVGLLDGETVIGTHAVGNAKVEDLRVCFKRHFLENKPEVNETIVRFVKGVLEVLRQNQQLKDLVDDKEKSCFVVGCPAGWTLEDRSRYRGLMEQAGMKNVRIASESRAAFENALRCNKDSVETKLIQKSVLVIDIGSSTLDLAYVCDGQEHNVEVVGDVKLGGGLMDEMILQYGLKQLGGKSGEAQQFLQDHPGWFSRVMFKARELKEQYFTNEDYYFDANETLEDVVKIFGDGKALKVPLMLSPEIVETYVISEPHPLLDKQSFESKLKNMLKTVHQKVKDREPRVVILTGGPSRMKFFQDLCKAEFKNSKVSISKEPEYDISRGLAYAGNVDEKAALMLEEIKTYVASDKVETKVKDGVPDLIDALSQKLTEAMIDRCAVPALQEWKRSDVWDTLDDLKDCITDNTSRFFASEEGRQVITEASTPWTKALMEDVQKDLDEIALAHKVNLNKLSAGGVDVQSDASAGTSPAERIAKYITNIVGIITSVVLAVISGGAGLALLATGPVGIIMGLVVGACLFFLGRERVEEVVMNLSIPKLARKMLKESIITGEKNAAEVEASLRTSLMNNQQLVSDLTTQVSDMIDDNLAQLVSNSETQIVA
ncbi:MAG: rod shape-determining protein [Clostridia bacterium]|nr:rod shape-determining protein [Clostridia bacterium]